MDYTQPKEVEQRVRFFDGQYLQDQDFIDEQKYHLDRERRLGKILRIIGIVEGLSVTSAKANQVTVAAGTAIDGLGRQLVLSSLLTAQDRSVDLPAAKFNNKQGVKLYIVYSEKEDGKPASGQGIQGAPRWLERPRLVAVTTDGQSSETTAWDDKVPTVIVGQFDMVQGGTVQFAPNSAQLAGMSVNGNIGIGTATPGARLSFSNVDSGDIGANGITWHNPTPTAYGIHRTAGAWTAPDFQQLRLGWQTGIVLDPGTQYGKSYVDIQGNGLRVTAGNVGIGTASPENGDGWNKVLDILGSGHAKLSVRTASIDARVLAHDTGFFGSPAGMIVGTKSNHPLSFGTNAATRMTISVSGNVGIGTATPGARLAVSGDNATVNIETDEVIRLLRPGVSAVKNNNSAGLKLGSFEQGVNGKARLDISLSGAPGGTNGYGSIPDVTVMSLLANGNVGIGTTTPSAKLSFSNVDSGDIGATGITWSNSAPTAYGIHRTAGAWTAPDYQQLRLGWQTGIVLDGGTAYGKSYVDVQGNGLRVAGAVRFLTDSNPLHFTSGWSNFPGGGTNVAEISNDTSAYKTLMIVGNRSNDAAVRRVSVWDRLEVNGTLMVSGGLTVLEQEAWKDIALTPGWGSYGSGYGPGEYFKDSHGVVHLRGLIKVTNPAAWGASAAAGNGHYLQLPSGYRPKYRQIFTTLAGNSNGLCRVDISTDGKLWGMSGSPGEWFSLDSISFRAE